MILDFNKLYNEYNLKIRGVISIGAYDGSETKIFEEKGINNFIYFEPSKKNFELLKRNVTDNGNLYNIALGEENKKINLYVESNNGGSSSSLLKSKLHSVYYPHIIFSETEEVVMKKLDDIEFDRNLFNFISIDVQGYELHVLKGGKNTLDNIDYIMTEINKVELYENCVIFEELNLFLENHGFIMVDINWYGETWGDAFFIRKNG
jgi:FkbM family methyltransferase